MDEILEVMQQIQELAGVVIEAITGAQAGGEAAAEGAPPAGGEGGAPPEPPA